MREFPLEFCNGGNAQKNWSRAPTRWWKEFDDMFIRLECDGQTDGRTDLLKQYRVLYA